ncbi:L-rhamnose/proton symporter RhaT [Chryseosolibacter indicus]|uniref:L-rhamnose/proton symporter RhaT n=1 Tax=Chryseosolibacter indicus TaxID=2782351 RepID=A0ABS5VXN0_9BACT|nr:L-rhamnose/proton symporter RhaT [Chryseosolibacter indicus]MBT1705607.1 L-rhamnose/proton symporter RhaT [Chryseosolibacter indicus]
MGIILGVLFHFLGGFASGSFYMAFKRVSGWSWETYWVIGGIFSWLVIPPLAAWITIPGFAAIIQQTDSTVITITYVMGLLWGVGGLTYGLGIRYLGMSLGNSVILGYCAAFGSLIPPLYYNLFPDGRKISFNDMMSSTGGRWVLLGVLVCLAGIAICGCAGMMKEKDLPEEYKRRSIAEFNLVKGLIVATVSGILSACFNFGIEAGKPMAESAVTLGYNPLFQNNVTYVVLLWGGLTTNFIWCFLLNARNKTFGDYINSKTPLLSNYFFSALAGTTWFMQFFFYGMGESKLGNGASSWILHMAFIILISNLWGIYLKEWKGVASKTRYTIIAGIVTILISVFLVGYGNSLE